MAFLLYNLPFSDTWDESQLPELNAKVAIVTGGTEGLGQETTRALVQHGAHVFLVARNLDKGRKFIEEITSICPNAKLDLLHIDVSSFASIRSGVEDFKSKGLPLHILVNNAGVGAPAGQLGQRTPEDFEVTYGTNYFGPFYLTHLLLDKLRDSAPARIVWVSSAAEAAGKVDWDDLKGARHKESGLAAYATSKLMDLMAAKEMARRLAKDKIQVFAVHPGVTNSGIFGKTDSSLLFSYALWVMNKSWGQSPARGARPLLYAAAAPELEDASKTGAYIGGFNGGNLWQTKERRPFNSQARDPSACARLYDETLAIVREAANDPHLAAAG